MKNIRILLADDHALTRTGIRKTVEEIAGIEIVGEVGDGPQVFAALARGPVDCLLLDVTMPNFEPVSAIREIHTRYPALKILVVSAYDDDIYVQGLLSAGVNGYHMKDQPLNDLKLAVERVLSGERWLSGSLISKLVGSPQTPTSIPGLTSRQRELLHLLQKGYDNQTIAHEIGLSVKTIENHLTRLYRQLGVQSRLEAVHFITQHPQILGISGQDAAQKIDSLADENQKKPVSILVVDDNLRYRKQLQRMIGKLSPQAMIYEAENVQTALSLAQRVELQLAMVDVVLGDEDGISCARRIKAVRPQSRIVLISAYPDREFHRQGMESGAAALLDKKDLDLATLRQVIDDVTA